MRERLRPALSAQALAQMYAVPHDHRRWSDHEIRVDATVALGRRAAWSGVSSAADLSCGNGSILAAIPAGTHYYGDLAPGYDITGSIEQTIEQIPMVDLFVCCETIEHLDDPDTVLKAIRAKTSLLLLSTPVDAWRDTNIEHYWAWSRDDVEQMLAAAGFAVRLYACLDLTPAAPDSYCFGIWICR